MKPNNVTRFLDAHDIHYATFELPPEKHGALETARLLDLPPNIVYKTIVVTREGKSKPILAVIPGPCEVDLKALARALDEKKLHLPSEREAERLTGLQAGGISPLALINRGFQVILDIAAQSLDEMHISGGQRGLNIRLAPNDLIKLTGARYSDICREIN